MLKEGEGKELIKIVREFLKVYLCDKKRIEFELPKKFEEKMGVFVTLKKRGDLRGCIGYPYPTHPLKTAIFDSAISAATKDPRFPPVTCEELDDLKIEITILTPPKLIECKPEDLPKNIEVGKDGLIVERGYYRGLLLPQVAPEWGWNSEEFLSHTCMKAGLPPDSWFDKDTKVYKFQGLIFEED